MQLQHLWVDQNKVLDGCRIVVYVGLLLDRDMLCANLHRTRKKQPVQPIFCM